MTSIDKHLAAIKAGSITKSNIIGIRKALNVYTRQASGWSIGRCSPKVGPDEALALQELTREHKPLVTGELHDSGVKVLTNPRYAKRWTDHELDVIDTLKEFRLVDWSYEGRWGQYAYPVYYAQGELGGFSFRNIPWQSGGNGPEVLGR